MSFQFRSRRNVLSQASDEACRIARKGLVGVRFGLLVVALTMFVTSAWSQNIDSDCQCRAPDGQMRDLGTVECVDIVGTRKMVRCEMSANTPFWKDIEGVEGCPDA